jgi:hypothetical protein
MRLVPHELRFFVLLLLFRGHSDPFQLWFVFVRLTTAQCIWCVCCGRCALM